MRKLEAGRQADEAFLANVGVGQPDGDLQIFAALGNGLAGHLNDGGPIGRLDGGDPHALVYVQVFPAGFFDLSVTGS